MAGGGAFKSCKLRSGKGGTECEYGANARNLVSDKSFPQRCLV